MPHQQIKRVFVVGAPRSGTTMIQGMLSSHTDFVSFPESHFFSFVTYDLHQRIYGRLAPVSGSRIMKQVQQLRGHIAMARGKANPAVKKRMALFLNRAGFDEDEHLFDKLPDRIVPLVDTYLDLLDRHANGKHWIEKTPNHVYFTDLIARHVPDARFVHVVRKGEDTLGSIMDAAQKYDNWAEFLEGDDAIARLIALWNRAAQASLARMGHPQHLVLSYERVAQDPQGAARKMAAFLDVPYQDGMAGLDTSRVIAQGEEPWKMNMGDTVRQAPSKFGSVFSADEQVQIKAGLIALPDGFGDI